MTSISLRIIELKFLKAKLNNIISSEKGESLDKQLAEEISLKVSKALK